MQLGAAGYDWWEKIAKVEHFTSLNDITGVLFGTVGTLPTVAEGAEYTEFAIGDSPETASFTKYGGYIPFTLELIDRDDTRQLKAYASELGNAARRKISALVSESSLPTPDVGPTMADGGASVQQYRRHCRHRPRQLAYHRSRHGLCHRLECRRSRHVEPAHADQACRRLLWHRSQDGHLAQVHASFQAP